MPGVGRIGGVSLVTSSKTRLPWWSMPAYKSSGWVSSMRRKSPVRLDCVAMSRQTSSTLVIVVLVDVFIDFVFEHGAQLDEVHPVLHPPGDVIVIEVGEA